MKIFMMEMKIIVIKIKITMELSLRIKINTNLEITKIKKHSIDPCHIYRHGIVVRFYVCIASLSDKIYSICPT
jgi:hypothetical protein